MRHFLLFALFCFSTITFAQNDFEKQLDSIQDETQATSFIQNHKHNQGKLLVFNKEKHKSQLAKELFTLGSGSKKVFKTDIDKTFYKVIDKYETPYYRVSYVFLDGSKKSAEEITKLRQEIIAKYNKGFQFKGLAKYYSMDESAKKGGDTGWFKAGELNPEFEQAVINEPHAIDAIFTVDVPEKQAYYVVVKTYDSKNIEEIKVLKVTEPLN